MFDRRDAPSAQVNAALTLLYAVADRDVAVCLVPGNHENGKLPLSLWTSHPGIHVFDQPRTYVCQAAGSAIALSGFPYAAEARAEFRQLVAATGYRDVPADAHLLCIHQTVEGARVGPQNYTFRSGRDVVRGADIPGNVAAVLAGHIHRCQMLTRTLAGAPLGAPVIYAGSVERTSFAEAHEPKAYAQITLDTRERSVQVQFVPLPTRPMVVVQLNADLYSYDSLIDTLAAQLARVPLDAVIQLRLQGESAETALETLSGSPLRAIAPETMYITLTTPRARARRPVEPAPELPLGADPA